MMTPLGSVRTTRARCSKLTARTVLALLLAGLFPSLSAQTDARAALRAAYQEFANRRWAEAAKRLRQAGPALPAIADHTAWLLASAELELKNYPAVIRALEPVWNAPVASPHVGDAALVAARAHLAAGAPQEALRVLRQHQARLPQPAGDALLASVYEATGDQVAAALHYQQVYYPHPTTREAAQASSALARLRSALGAAFPPPPSEAMFQRAERWLRVGEARRARAEYESMAARVGGLDRELARVRVGAADYAAGRTTAAHSHLKSLELSFPEADAERLYYLAECARRLEKDDELISLVDRLGALYPQSPWRLKALISAGNRQLIQNRPEIYERLYRACYESFPAESQAAYCQWKVAWSAYLRRRPEAAEALRTHLRDYPGSEKADTALYFLGRLAETARNLETAKAYYTEAADRHTNHYYAMLAEDRLAQPELFRVVASREVTEFLHSVVWPVRQYPDKFDPAPVTRLRLERARLLYAAGVDALADKELRFGARTDSQAHLAAIELAQAAIRRGSYAQGIRIMKSLAPGYLAYPLESAPAAFWRLLFPLPYRADLERYARWRGLEPFLVAGLIRQESEFDPRAISVSHAYGLTQILPATGRMLARKLGQRRFRTSMLFSPDFNLRLGTYYLQTLFEKHAAEWEPTLAAYNAGSTRVENWLTWASFREPAEFIETIPFTETRNYVLAVLRNARLYRRLYSAERGLLAADAPLAPKAAPKKTGAFQRTPVVPKQPKARR
jgi:soluble lytic murein transglycosylase